MVVVFSKKGSCEPHQDRLSLAWIMSQPGSWGETPRLGTSPDPAPRDPPHASRSSIESAGTTETTREAEGLVQT